MLRTYWKRFFYCLFTTVTAFISCDSDDTGIMKDKKFSNNTAILVAIIAAVLYALSTPISKRLLAEVAPTMIAAFLYLGAGIGVGAMLLGRKLCNITTNEQPKENA